MCIGLPKAPDPVTVPERQPAQQPKTNARTTSNQNDLRRRGYASLIVAGNKSALQPVSTTPTVLGTP
jgi:hypothetical protein